MEKLFVMLSALASTTTNVPLANGLDVLKNSMLDVWEKTMGEIASLKNSVDYWRNLYHAERNVSLLKTEDLENFRAECHKKEQERDRNNVENMRIFSNEHLCWDVTIPYTWIKKYKEYAVGMLQAINPNMPLGDAYARVENAIVKKQEMFSTLLNTTEYLEVRKALYRTGSIRSDDFITDGVEIKFIP